MSVKVKLAAGQELSELGKMKAEVSPATAFSQGYVVFFSENTPVTADGYTSLEIAFNISMDENSQYYRITSADGATTALLDPASANRVFVMVDQYKDIILGDIKVIEMSRVKQKENLLEQIGDYPEFDIIRGATASRISGQIMTHSGSNKATLEFIDELHEDYNAAYDVDGNGYLNILNRDRETAGLSYSCNHTGVCIDLNKLADNYGSGLYTYSINVKLTPGQEASSAFFQLEASAAKQFVRGRVAINTEANQVTDSKYTTLSFSFKLVKQNGFYVLSLPDGTNSVVLDNQSFNRIFLRIDEYKDITIDGISIIK